MAERGLPLQVFHFEHVLDGARGLPRCGLFGVGDGRSPNPRACSRRPGRAAGLADLPCAINPYISRSRRCSAEGRRRLPGAPGPTRTVLATTCGRPGMALATSPTPARGSGTAGKKLRRCSTWRCRASSSDFGELGFQKPSVVCSDRRGPGADAQHFYNLAPTQPRDGSGTVVRGHLRGPRRGRSWFATCPYPTGSAGKNGLSRLHWGGPTPDGPRYESDGAEDLREGPVAQPMCGFGFMEAHRHRRDSRHADPGV